MPCFDCGQPMMHCFGHVGSKRTEVWCCTSPGCVAEPARRRIERWRGIHYPLPSDPGIDAPIRQDAR